MQTASPRTVLRSWPLLCLLLLAGCQSESAKTPAASELAEFIDPSKPYSELRFTILEPRENQPHDQQFTPGNFEFPSNPKHYFSIPNLTHENVGEYVAELYRLGIKRVEVTNPDDYRYRDQPPKQRELLRKFFETCPPLETLRIENWQLSILDLGRFLNESQQLGELHLTRCWMIGEKGMTSYDEGWEFGLKALSVNSCYHAGDLFMASILDRSPDLGELSIREYFKSDPLTGYNWPFHKLKKLRKFSLHYSDKTSDILRQLTPHATELESLSIDDCQNLSDYTWDVAKFGNLKELKLRQCEDIQESKAGDLLAGLPRLKVLSISGCDQVTGRFFANLEMPDIEGLFLSGRQFDKAAVSKFVSASTSLRELDVYQVGSLDLSNHVALKSLTIRNGYEWANAASIPNNVESLSLLCNLSQESIGKLLTRLKNLRTLDLTVYPLDLSTDDSHDPAEWDLSALVHLTDLRLWHQGCSDELIKRTLTAPSLRRLTIGRNSEISGKCWLYPKSLEHLSLWGLDKLDGECLNDLPYSIETVEISSCDNLVGRHWDFSHLGNLTQLSFSHCGQLTSIGKALPPQLISLTIFECPLSFIDFDFSKCSSVQNLQFFECHNLPVDRLFATLSNHPTVLRTLNLRACPNLKTKDWDLSHLSKTLEEIDYKEGESSLTGGIDAVNLRILKKQLPECNILSSPYISD